LREGGCEAHDCCGSVWSLVGGGVMIALDGRIEDRQRVIYGAYVRMPLVQLQR